MEQAQDIARLGYYEINWQTDTGYWSDGFFTILGYDPAEKSFSHEQFMQHIHEKDRKHVASHFEQSLTAKTPMNIEFRVVDKNGGEVTVHCVAKHFFDDNEVPLYTQGVFQDISARKIAEKELSKYREGLEGLVEERTSELRKVVNIMAGREVRMAELKKETQKLQEQLKNESGNK